MKRHPHPDLRTATRCAAVWLAAIAGHALASTAAPPAPAGANSEPKTHTLYLGADFSLEWNKQFYPIVDVSGGSFVIKPKGKLVKVPMNQGGSRLQLRQALKVSGISTTVAHLQSDRAYTPGRDPFLKLQSAAANAEYNQNRQDQTYRSGAEEFGRHNFLQSIAIPGSQVAADMSHKEAAEAAVISASTNEYQLSQTINNLGAQADVMQNELNREQFDAMEISFEVSSEKPLGAPYLVVIARHHAPGSKPGALQDWIHAEALDAIGPQPRRIHIKKGGLTPGFELKEVQLHLYNHGEEVATNVASQRVLLTRDEAFKMMVIDYVQSHKGATLPPVLAMGEFPADLATRLPVEKLRPAYYVKVAENGKASGIFEDRQGTQKVDDALLTSVVENLRFHPALENGKPAPGIAQLKLSRPAE